MQFVNKGNSSPIQWEDWFTVYVDGYPPRRTYNFYECQNKTGVKQYLVAEQHWLCAYCQRDLLDGKTEQDALHYISIEHVVPHSLNPALSTAYHNLVAVCKISGENNFCESVRGNQLLPALIFYSDCAATEESKNSYFSCDSTGAIMANYQNQNDEHRYAQVRAFIEILNLNDYELKGRRRKALTSIIDGLKGIATADQVRFKRQERKNILANYRKPYRQYLLNCL